jgi:hypothetical protein
LDRKGGGPTVAEVGALLGEGLERCPPLRQLDPKRLPPDETREGCDPCLVVCKQVGRGRVFIRLTGFRLPDPDADRVSRWS